MKHQLISMFVLAVSALTLRASDIILTPGSLRNLIKKIETEAPAALTLKGQADVTDLAWLKHLPPSVKSIDMSALEILPFEYQSGDYFGRKSFAAGELPPYMLFDTEVTEVKLPLTATALGEGLLASTPLSSIEIPAGVTTIGPFAFYECGNLKRIVVKGTITKLGEGAFARCSGLTSFPADRFSVNIIPASCFEDCIGIDSIAFPSSVKTIESKAFYGSGLVSVDLPYVMEIGDYAFAHMPRLTTMTLNPNVKAGVGAFFNNPLLTTLSNQPLEAAPLLAAHSNIRYLDAYVRGREIGEGAYAAINVDSLTFFEDVEHINDHAFRNIRTLRQIDVANLVDRVPTVSENAFEGVDVENVSLYVKPGTEDLWTSAPVWKEFKIAGRETGVEVAGTDTSEITVVRRGDVIEVRSANPLISLDIYAIDGRVIYSDRPDATGCDVPAAELPEMLIVRASDGKITKVVKLI